MIRVGDEKGVLDRSDSNVDEEEMYNRELIELFKRTQTADCWQALGMLHDHFAENAFEGDFRIISTFLFPFYDDSCNRNDDILCLVNETLRMMVLNSVRMADFLVDEGFDDLLFRVVPRANSLRLLALLMTLRTDAAEKYSCHDTLSRIKPLITTRCEQTSDAIYVLGAWVSEQINEDHLFSEVLEAASTVTLEIRDVDVTCSGFDMFGKLCRRYYQFINFVFQNPLFESFLESVYDENIVYHFLSFIERAFSNPFALPGMHPGSAVHATVSNNVRICLFRFISSVLESDSDKLVESAAKAAARLTFNSACLDGFMAFNVDVKLFGLLRVFERFECRAALFRALCEFAANSISHQTQRLLDQGFMDVMNEMIEATCETIPHPILNALETLCRYAELENNSFFGEIFGSSEIVHALETMKEFDRTDEDDAMNGTSVSWAAKACYERNGNIPFA